MNDLSYLNEITIGITTFDRPKKCERAVAAILSRYGWRECPPIIVADNGRLAPKLPCEGYVDLIKLDYDSGLSASRNAIVEACDTPFLLMLEDDVIFTSSTDLYPMWRKLTNIYETTNFLVGGRLIMQGQEIDYACDLDADGDTLRILPAQRTDDGIYQPCDMTLNFFMAKTEPMRSRLRWDESLKLGEHTEWFWRVKTSISLNSPYQYKVWQTPYTVALHERDGSGNAYGAMRSRARNWNKRSLEKHGFKRQWISPDIDKYPPLRSTETRLPFAQLTEDKPDVVVFGVGHSGTSVVTKMLHELGWQALDADEEYGESVSVRDINRALCKRVKIDPTDKLAEVLAWESPWAIKDPRFIETIDWWMQVFLKAGRMPTLIWLTRDIDRVIESYKRRGEVLADGAAGTRGRTVDQLYELADRGYRCWPWPKLKIDFDEIPAALGVFDVDRAESALEMARR